MRYDLEQMKFHIYEDGEITEDEVDLIRTILDAHGIGEEEVYFLIDLNNILSGERRAENFDLMFVDEIGRFLLGEEGVVEDAVWSRIRQRLERDNKIDELERALLVHVAGRARRLPDDMVTLLG